MAMYNEILSARYNRLIQRLMGMKGGAPAPQLSGDISAGITLEAERPEWGFLSGDFRCSARITKAADVANFSGCGLFNGTNTGTLAVVEGVVITAAATNGYKINLGATTALGSTARGNALDTRWLGKQSSCLVGSFVEAAATGLTVWAGLVLANTSLFVPTPWCSYVFPPNSSQIPIPNVVVSGQAINTAVDVCFLWRERQMEASEGPTGV